MWMTILSIVLPSKIVKILVLSLLNYLVKHNSDGITGEFAKEILDQIAKDTSNNITPEAIAQIKQLA